MNPLNFLLGKYSKILHEGEADKTALIAAVLSATGCELAGDQVVIKNQTARLKVGPSVRSEIFIKRKEILDLTNEALGAGLKITDIR